MTKRPKGVDDVVGGEVIEAVKSPLVSSHTTHRFLLSHLLPLLQMKQVVRRDG